MTDTEQIIAQQMKEMQLQPRDYQIRIISKAVDAFNAGRKSVMIESPCGSGKTPMGLVTCKMLEKSHPTMQFGWVAMRRKLLTQAQKENERVNVKNIQFLSMFDKNPPKADMIITDESHHDAAQTCATLHQKMETKLSFGLSATPFRTDRVQLCYEKIISDCGVRYLIEKDYLSPFDQYAIPKWTPQTVADQFLRSPEKWGQSIVFMQTQNLCFDLQNKLLHGGVMADVILGTDSNTRREEIFNAFESGESQVLINVYLLTEGFDCPKLQSVWVRDSCKLCTMQMAGRVLRKDPEHNNKVAQIIQSEQTPFPYSKVAKPRTQNIWDNNKWLSLEPGANIDKLINIIRKKVLTKQINIPAYLNNKITSIGIGRNGQINQRRSRPRNRQYI